MFGGHHNPVMALLMAGEGLIAGESSRGRNDQSLFKF
jgi:hypothetical protein